MANSYAYVLSANKYPDAFQANLIGAQQGTIIVYAAAETLSSGDVLFTDSKLTQPVYGDPAEWYGVQLLTNTSVKYPITIGEDNEIVVGSGTTTTTTAGPTTTTTTTAAAASTTTTTAASTTTTTTVAVYSDTAITGFSGGGVCSGSGTSVTMYYTGTLGVGTPLYTNPGLTAPYLGATGNYVRLYFNAQYNVCYVTGVGGDNTIVTASAC